MNYLDLGYDQNLSQFTGFPDFTSTTNLNGFEGMDASQVLTLGRIESPNKQFYIDFDNNHIEIDSINWSKGTGGTLVLGGSRNSKGTFSLQDENNVEKIFMDKDGMTIYDGNITIKNDQNTTIIDPLGLVSTSNFRNGTVSATSTQTTTSTVASVLDSMELETPNFTRDTQVLILFTCQNQIVSNDGVDQSFSGAVAFQLAIDGVGIQEMYMTNFGESGTDPYSHDGTGWQTSSMHYLQNIGPGSHTLQIYWGIQDLGGNPKGICPLRTFSFTSLGY